MFVMLAVAMWKRRQIKKSGIFMGTHIFTHKYQQEMLKHFAIWKRLDVLAINVLTENCINNTKKMRNNNEY
jgi:hypothetical protein